jgi:hypothetical protein
MNLLKGLDPTMTLEEAIAETARVRAEKKKARHAKSMVKFREVHHEKVLEAQRAYREANREKINLKKKEDRALKKLQGG